MVPIMALFYGFKICDFSKSFLNTVDILNYWLIISHPFYSDIPLSFSLL